MGPAALELHPSSPDMANWQEKEVDPFDARHVPAGTFVLFLPLELV